jgi:exodeoxyribonuclease VII large subunit
MQTVSQLVALLKQVLEEHEGLSNIWVQGEISNFKRATSGHCYFTLKDSGAAIPCVMWRNDAQRLTQLPGDGDRVVVHGRVSIYEAQGKVQLYVDELQPAGLGLLYQELEALKARLAADGLFAAERKRPLPPWPGRIGVVTSGEAAAWRDILRTLRARYPLVEVMLAPAAVQGADAPPQIVAAIELVNRWSAEVEPVDVILLARGGGSIEELWAFNDEWVVRAVADSDVPVITGVGHETDQTLVDLAADRRAATPTAAAALAVPDSAEVSQQVAALRGRLARATTARLGEERQQLEQARRALLRESPERQLAGWRQRVEELSQLLARSLGHRLELQQAQIAGLRDRLVALDPQRVLGRGYAIVRRADTAEVVTAAYQVAIGDPLRITVHHGHIDSTVTGTDQEQAG